MDRTPRPLTLVGGLIAISLGCAPAQAFPTQNTPTVEASPAHAPPAHALSDEALAELIARFQAGIAALSANRYDEAVEVLTEVAADAATGLGETHSETLKTRSWLAFALLNAERPDDAFVEADATEALALATLGPDHATSDRVSVVLAVRDVRAGRMEAAEQRLVRSLEWNRAQGDESSAAGIGALLAMVYRQQARDQEADQLLALASGSAEPAMVDLAQLEAAIFREDDAAIMISADRLLANPAVRGSAPLRATVARAGVLLRRGDIGEAEAALRQAAAHPALTRDPILGVAVTDELAAVLLTDDADHPGDPARTEEALALQRAGIGQSERILGPRHITTLQRRLSHAASLLGLERDDEAEAAYASLLAEDDAEPGLLLSPLRAAAELGLGAVLMRDGRALEGYRRLRDSTAGWVGFALSSGGREEASGYVSDNAMIFRVQVQAAWRAQAATREGT